MRLRLKYPPTPDNARLFAADIVESARTISGVELDYTTPGVAAVDEIIEDIRQDGPPLEDVAETMFGFGCYVGEVLVREGVGRWDAVTDQEMGFVGAPLLIRTPDGGWHNPIGKAFKRYENGPEDNLAFFCHAILNPPPS